LTALDSESRPCPRAGVNQRWYRGAESSRGNRHPQDGRGGREREGIEAGRPEEGDNQCRVSEPGDRLASPGPGCDDHGAFQPDDEKVEADRHRGGFPWLASGDNPNTVGEVVEAQIEQYHKDGPEARLQVRDGGPKPPWVPAGPCGRQAFAWVSVELRLDYPW
jgi:hypothetical protein